MTRRENGRRGFTLAEMIAAAALLALFSVFIVQMFVKADQISRKARILDMAAACASNLADQWKMDGTEDVPAPLLDLRQNRSAGRTATISLDADFNICPAEEAVYAAVLTIDPGEADGEASKPSDSAGGNGKEAARAGPSGLWTLTLVIGRAGPSDNGPVYSLQVTRYFPEEAVVP